MPKSNGCFENCKENDNLNAIRIIKRCYYRRIAADEARIVTVLHPFDANEYVTMDEIEEMEQTIKNTQTEETSVKGKRLRVREMLLSNKLH